MKAADEVWEEFPVFPAWSLALIAVASFGAGVFITWDYLRPGLRGQEPPEGDDDDG